jgi:hypothetical protein
MSRPRPLLLLLPLLLAGALAAQVRPPVERAYGPAAQQAAGQLLAELDSLRNHVRHALAGPAQQDVGRRADASRELGLRLYRVLGANAGRPQIYESHRALDNALNDLFATAQRVAPGDRELQRRVLHTRSADEQLHAALSQGDASEERRRELLRRQADVLVSLADDFAAEAGAGRPEPGARPLARESRQLAEAATRFRRTLDQTPTLEAASRAFTPVLREWGDAQTALDALPYGDTADLRARAARVGQVVNTIIRVFSPAAPPPANTGVPPPNPVFPPLQPIAPPRGQHLIAFGAGAGGGPHVRLFHGRRGADAVNFYAYDPDFTGGVRVAVADVNGDGILDVITAPGPGMPPLVRVFSGRDLSIISEFYAYDREWTGGLFVAAADITGNGKAEIVTGADAGGGPHVRIFRGDGQLLREFFPYDRQFRGGVRVAIGDVNGDGVADVVTAPGPGMPPLVRVFDGRNLSVLRDWMAYEPNFQGGVFVALADLTRQGRDEIVTGADAGGGPHVRIFNGLTGRQRGQFFAYDEQFKGGVRVAVQDVNRDGVPDIVTAPGPGASPVIRVFSGETLRLVTEFNAYDPRFGGGAYVGGR